MTEKTSAQVGNLLPSFLGHRQAAIICFLKYKKNDKTTTQNIARNDMMPTLAYFSFNRSTSTVKKLIQKYCIRTITYYFKSKLCQKLYMLMLLWDMGSEADCFLDFIYCYLI